MTELKENAISPFCSWLRSKRYYTLTAPPKTETDLLDISQDCWCEKTQESVGPGGEIVDPDYCRVGRHCFERYGG